MERPPAKDQRSNHRAMLTPNRC